MKIVVCVKAVPDASSGRRLDPSTKRLDRSAELTLSDFDGYAVEEALQIGGEVVVLSLGPERALDALRKALAMGADRAVLVSGDTLAGSDLLGTASALAEAVAPGPDELALSPPPPRGESVKIDDDGSAAEKIVEYLAEKRLV